MDFMEKLKDIATERGTTLTGLERECGFSNNSIKRWGKSSPSVDKVIQLAQHLNISLDELLLDKKNTSKLSDESANLLDLYYLLPSEERQKFMHYLEVATIEQKRSCNVNESVSHDTILTYDVRTIPIRGYVAAGTPIEAIENNLGTVEVPSNLDADYALIVSGNSMDPLIKDGEHVYVKFTNELNINDIGVFYYNGNVTCKKFFKNDVMVKLVSINPTYEDFIFYLNDSKNETINFIIEGQVILSANQQKRLSQYYQMTH